MIALAGHVLVDETSDRAALKVNRPERLGRVEMIEQKRPHPPKVGPKPLPDGDRETHLGTVDGRVRLVAEWSLTDDQGSVSLFQFESTVRQTTDGYHALVDAHGTLLEALASAIANGLD